MTTMIITTPTNIVTAYYHCHCDHHNYQVLYGYHHLLTTVTAAIVTAAVITAAFTSAVLLFLLLQWWIQGRGPGGPPPLFLDQAEVRRAEKCFLKTTPPLLRVWMTLFLINPPSGNAKN